MCLCLNPRTRLDGSKPKPDSSIKSHTSLLFMQHLGEETDRHHKNKNMKHKRKVAINPPTNRRVLLKEQLGCLHCDLSSDVVVFMCFRSHDGYLMKRIKCLFAVHALLNLAKIWKSI